VIWGHWTLCNNRPIPIARIDRLSSSQVSAIWNKGQPEKQRIQEVLEEEGCQAEVREVLVTDAEAAHTVEFLGSPMVRINGIDIEPGALGSQEFGLMCRRYSDGLPSYELIRTAIRAASKDGGRTQ
jgi:hypothetical protein